VSKNTNKGKVSKTPVLDFVLKNELDLPFECCDCPFGTADMSDGGPNVSDPGEGFYFCSLFDSGEVELRRRRQGNSITTEKVWGENPVCKIEDWVDAIRKEVDVLSGKKDG